MPFSNLDPSKALTLRNCTCPYCDVDLASLRRDEKDYDHVIGRRFVPKGSLSGKWNLKVRACKQCQGRKSDLENDISAITMQPDATGEYPRSDAMLTTEAERKASGSISHRTGRPVGSSSETQTLRIPFGSAGAATFELIGGPQVDPERMFALARLQVAAFWYLLTYRGQAKRGVFVLPYIYPVHEATRHDWGNPVQRSFANAITEWRPILFVDTAAGYYKAVMRRHPGAACWAWGLEWNVSRRIIGFLGDQEPARAVVAELERPEARMLPRQPDGSVVRIALQQPLAAENDSLFDLSHWADRGALDPV